MAKKKACPVGSHRVKGRCRSIKEMCYHGRCGHPVIHENEAGRKYIMTRKPSG